MEWTQNNTQTGKKGELRVEAYYILILLLPLSPLWSSPRLVAKLGPSYVRDKVSILLTSRRLKVYLGEMKNQSGVIYKELLLAKACVSWK